jgi:hypothetical protein
MVYIQCRELMGDTILNFPAAEQSAVQPPQAFIDGQQIEASASLRIDLHQYRRVSLSGHE